MNEKDPKPLIRLYGSIVGVIVLRESGVLYSNQTGGNYCLQPEEEGVYIPIDDEVFDHDNKRHRSLNDILEKVFKNHYRVGKRY